MIQRHFTFGQVHTTTYEGLPDGHMLADYWVTVQLPEELDGQHRTFFINHFTKLYCPDPAQFGFEYRSDELDQRYFPRGCLCLINQEGILL